MKLYNMLLIAGSLFLLLFSCQKQRLCPSLKTTSEAKSKGESTTLKPGANIDVGAIIKNESGVTITERGICYVYYSSFDKDVNIEPSVRSQIIPVRDIGNSSFTVRMSLSLPNSIYKIKPYCIMNGIAYYGDFVEFKTGDLKGERGDQGPIGPKGDTGMQGPKGDDGGYNYPRLIFSALEFKDIMTFTVISPRAEKTYMDIRYYTKQGSMTGVATVLRKELELNIGENKISVDLKSEANYYHVFPDRLMEFSIVVNDIVMKKHIYLL